MSLDIYYDIYIGTSADELFDFVSTETLREPRFDIRTGHRLEDYVETKLVITSRNGVLSAKSRDLTCLSEGGDGFGYIYAGTLDESIITDESEIVLPLKESGSIQNSGITSVTLNEWQADIDYASSRFKELTGFDGELKVYFVENVSV